MDNSKSKDAVISYDKYVTDVKCLNKNDLKYNITSLNSSSVTLCVKYIKTLGDPYDEHKDECPVGSFAYPAKNICISNVYDSVCDTGYEKIDNKCYKKCDEEYISVDINSVNITNTDSGSKCVINKFIK